LVILWGDLHAIGDTGRFLRESVIGQDQASA
jgi:hypothetical protein